MTQHFVLDRTLREWVAWQSSSSSLFCNRPAMVEEILRQVEQRSGVVRLPLDAPEHRKNSTDRKVGATHTMHLG
jgi:hypothetical protein